jgi:hypothetical protein
MVKRRSGKVPQAKSAKKRARRIGKLRKSVVPKGVLRDAWDEGLTSAQNLGRVGLTAAVNSITPVVAPSRRRNEARLRQFEASSAKASPPPAAPRQDVLDVLEREAARPEKVAKKVVRPGEERALREMIAAHGDDYEAMARDIKRNYLQWTPSHLRRKCERRRRVLGGSA